MWSVRANISVIRGVKADGTSIDIILARSILLKSATFFTWDTFSGRVDVGYVWLFSWNRGTILS